MLENGSRFGKLTISGSEVREQASGKRRRFYRCVCDCGGETWAASHSLMSGNTTTCGCLQREKAAARLRKHGDRGAPEYVVWMSMLNRCRNPNERSYKDYGGRGITVCSEWERYENFLRDMGRRPSAAHTIDRTNNELGYGPGNCVWATRKHQNRNKRSTVIVEVGGRKMPLVDAAEAVGLKPNTVTIRLRRGWTLEQALTP